jgi:hypothetical protein
VTWTRRESEDGAPAAPVLIIGAASHCHAFFTSDRTAARERVQKPPRPAREAETRRERFQHHVGTVNRSPGAPAPTAGSARPSPDAVLPHGRRIVLAARVVFTLIIAAK